MMILSSPKKVWTILKRLCLLKPKKELTTLKRKRRENKKNKTVKWQCWTKRIFQLILPGWPAWRTTDAIFCLCAYRKSPSPNLHCIWSGSCDSVLANGMRVATVCILSVLAMMVPACPFPSWHPQKPGIKRTFLQDRRSLWFWVTTWRPQRGRLAYSGQCDEGCKPVLCECWDFWC